VGVIKIGCHPSSMVNALKSEVATLKQTLAEMRVQAVQDHERLVDLHKEFWIMSVL